jgi:predicted tellurium resistance membrane protein TerC
MMTAAFFASIVFYYGDVRGLLPTDPIIKYLMLFILVVVGIRYLVGFVHGINILHEPMK